ncbi:MAG: hypothetical protein ACK4MF_09105 [Hyphomicrobiaceae bacterium]
MKSGLAALLGCTVALLATGAAAFQEQQGAPAGGTAVQAPASASKPAIEFSEPAVDAKAANGTEVRIPGLGTLGVLPKMDFGLELLYGAAGEVRAPEARPDSADDGDLRIRGTVKHRF